MSEPNKEYKSWNACSGCGFQGLFVFFTKAGEDYDDDDALGVLMDTKCPACDDEENSACRYGGVPRDGFYRQKPIRWVMDEPLKNALRSPSPSPSSSPGAGGKFQIGRDYMTAR